MPTYQGAGDLTNQSEQFIKKYAPGGFDIFDAGTPLTASIPKTFGHQGETFNATLNLSYGGGRGFGSLPSPSNWLSKRVSFARKKAYYRGRLDREALYASKDGGAVRDLFKSVSIIGPLSFRGMTEYSLFAKYATDGSNNVVGSGILGTATAVTGSDPYTITMANDFKAANFEIGDIVNIETGNTDTFEVTGIDVDNTQITVARVTGTQIPVTTDEVFLQGSEDNAFLGAHSMLDFVSGDNLYGVAHQYRFAPTRVDAAGALTIAKMEDVILRMGELTGQGPDLIVIPKDQWPTLTALLEGDKRYDVTMPKRDIEGHMGFKGLVFVHPYGTAIVHLSRYADSDRVYFFNTSQWEYKFSRGFGWFKDSGSVFLTRPDDDELEVRYGGYGEFFGIPTYHGLLYGIV